MRLFVAVDVPTTVNAAIERDVVEPLRGLDGARWTRPEGRHLTLTFLGEAPDADPIAEALRGVDVRAFEAAFDRVGGFPNLQRPRVLWVGIGTGADAMRALATDVERALEPLGFAPASKGFRAHLTIARFKRPGPIGELPAVSVPSDRFPVDGFVLYRSQLHPRGARYTPLERFA